MSERPSITVEDLERWTDNGAQWRALEVSDERAVVELCTCYGEPVDVVEGTDAGADRVRARARGRLPAGRRPS